MIRNCLIAAGNSGDAGAGRQRRGRISAIADPVVAEAARLGDGAA